jgi:hypothetical protein
MKNGQKFLCVTLDTEVDRDPLWRISNPVSFSSITRGIPELLSPLFRKYGVKPTYLLSAEVMEDRQSVGVLLELQRRGEAELGTHLHVEFVEPHRTLFRESMAGFDADATQNQLSAELEEQKLQNLTDSFVRSFGHPPTAFRAGRFAMGQHTLPILAKLGYCVDSSVTPGIYWDYPEGVVDYRTSIAEPEWRAFGDKKILELPVSIRPQGPLAPFVRDLPSLSRRAILKLAGRYTEYCWLRPSFSSGTKMIALKKSSPLPFMVMMLHSMEVIPKASPYAQTQADVQRILQNMEEFFAHCVDDGVQFVSMTEAASHVPA